MIRVLRRTSTPARPSTKRVPAVTRPTASVFIGVFLSAPAGPGGRRPPAPPAAGRRPAPPPAGRARTAPRPPPRGRPGAGAPAGARRITYTISASSTAARAPAPSQGGGGSAGSLPPPPAPGPQVEEHEGEEEQHHDGAGVDDDLQGRGQRAPPGCRTARPPPAATGSGTAGSGWPACRVTASSVDSRATAPETQKTAFIGAYGRRSRTSEGGRSCSPWPVSLPGRRMPATR